MFFFLCVCVYGVIICLIVEGTRIKFLLTILTLHLGQTYTGQFILLFNLFFYYL